MNNNNHPQQGFQQFLSEEKQTFNFRELLFKYVLRYWYFYIIGLVICLMLGKLYLKATPAQYAVKASLLIKDTESSNALSEASVLTDLGLGGGNSNMDNEISILKSKSLMSEVVIRLRLNISSKVIGRISESEIYKNAPFTIEPLDSSGFSGKGRFEIKMLDNQKFQLTEGNKDPITYSFGLPVQTALGQILVNRNEEIPMHNLPIEVTVSEIYATATRFSNKLEIKKTAPYSDVLDINFRDEEAQRAADIVNTLIEVYQEAAIEDKNLVSKNTLKFIEERLDLITGELSGVESLVESFKEKNQTLLDNPENPTILLGGIKDYEKELNQELVRLTIVETIENYLKSNLNSYELLPANLANSAELQVAINTYNEKVLQHERLLRSAGENNPTLQQLRKELKEYQQSILKSIQKAKQDVNTGITNIQANLRQFEGRIGTLPRKQREFLEISRQQHIKENLFLYLLEKREETALSLAMTTSNSRLIDAARASRSPVEPVANTIWLAVVLLGLILPAIVIFIINMLKNTIETEKDIKDLTTIPFFGAIGENKTESQLVVKANSRSALAEMFRMLRTNLQYGKVGEGSQTILLTSNVSGEGKSFLTLNLGISMALANYKTVIVGLDLRKPKLSKYLEFDENAKGVSQFLIGANTLDEVTYQLNLQENLYFVPSGPVPPNPGELLQSEKLRELLTGLSATFDYILIDSPPIGLVSDAMVLNQYASRTLFVVRYGVTRRDFLKMLENEYQQGKLRKPAIIFNGVKTNKGYGNSYGYGYGYGYGYYDEDEKKTKGKKKA